jgi:hypothetical protein
VHHLPPLCLSGQTGILLESQRADKSQVPGKRTGGENSVERKGCWIPERSELGLATTSQLISTLGLITESQWCSLAPWGPESKHPLGTSRGKAGWQSHAWAPHPKALLLPPQVISPSFRLDGECLLNPQARRFLFSRS